MEFQILFILPETNPKQINNFFSSLNSLMMPFSVQVHMTVAFKPIDGILQLLSISIITFIQEKKWTFIFSVSLLSQQVTGGMFSFIITVLGLGVSCLVLGCKHFLNHLWYLVHSQLCKYWHQLDFLSRNGGGHHEILMKALSSLQKENVSVSWV